MSSSEVNKPVVYDLTVDFFTTYHIDYEMSEKQFFFKIIYECYFEKNKLIIKNKNFPNSSCTNFRENLRTILNLFIQKLRDNDYYCIYKSDLHQIQEAMKYNNPNWYKFYSMIKQIEVSESKFFNETIIFQGKNCYFYDEDDYNNYYEDNYNDYYDVNSYTCPAGFEINLKTR